MSALPIVVRRSSLGDVVLAGAVTKALGACGFVTHPRHHELVRRFYGVEAVYAPSDRLPPGSPVIDLHADWRTAVRHPFARRVDPARVARHLRVAFKRPPPAGVVARYAAAAGVVAAQRPWLPPVRRGTTLIVAPGAAHRTKRWPGWAALAAAWDGPVRAIGGPGEEALVDAIGGVCERGFTRTLEAMEGGAVLAAGDTGLLHLGFAVGLPVVGVFGPTTSIDGFFGHVSPGEGAAVELDLPCRPCSRFGGDTCFLGDHACMRGLPVEAVLAACRRMAAT